MKSVLILFGKSDGAATKPFRNKDCRLSYEHLYSLCRNKGVQLYRASYEWYDYKKSVFKSAWIFEGFGSAWKKVKNIKPDLIYDKTQGTPEAHYKKELIRLHYQLINDPLFTMLLNNKLVTSIIFEKWSKKSWIVRSADELLNFSKKIKTSRIVIKPVIGSGGEDIVIISKSRIREIAIHKDMLIQEFIDSSRGVPGVTSGVHDLRLVLVNKKIIYSFIRKPKKGNLLANLAQGGSLEVVPIKKIPTSVIPIVQHASRVFESYEPRIFTIDIMFDKSYRPWVVELNSMPGLYFTPEEKPSMLLLYAELLRVFQKKLGAQ